MIGTNSKKSMKLLGERRTCVRGQLENFEKTKKAAAEINSD
jgi:hypothetical protein